MEPSPALSATDCADGYVPAGTLADGAAGATVSLTSVIWPPWNVPSALVKLDVTVIVPSAREATDPEGTVAVRVLGVPAARVPLAVTVCPALSFSVRTDAVTFGSALPVMTRSVPTLPELIGEWLALWGSLGA